LRRSFSSNPDTSDWKLFHSVNHVKGLFGEISTPPQLIEEIQQKCGVNGPFGFYGNERNNQRLDSCAIRSADLYQDFVAELFAWLERHLGGRGNA
jgi:hypothetical protein